MMPAARIRIIDDDAELVENTSAILSARGYEVGSLLTTDGALESLIEDTPDLLVLDVMFPDNPVAGLQLAREIRRRREIRGLPIILMSNVNQEFPRDFSPDDIHPEWMPVQDFVDKTAGVERIVEKVDELLGSRQEA